MKTFEVIEYLMNEIKNDLDYKEWYSDKKNELMEEWIKDASNKENYYNFLKENKHPKSATIKQNLKKIRKLTLQFEKTIK